MVPGIAGRSDDTWAVHVHGHEADRSQTIDLLPTFVEHGIDSLVVTYRNDEGAPPSDGSHHGIGADEWEDIEAAVVFAFDSGAQDLVLVGYGSGGAVVLTFLRESIWRRAGGGGRVGLPLPRSGVDGGCVERSRRNVPGFLTGWGKALATFRFGVDWAILDQVAAAEDFIAPMLLIQGDDDAITPIRVADAFAERRPDLVEYLRLDGVGHLGGYAADPDLYAGAVGAFLRRVAVGPTVLPEFVLDPDVE